MCEGCAITELYSRGDRADIIEKVSNYMILNLMTVPAKMWPHMLSLIAQNWALEMPAATHTNLQLALTLRLFMGYSFWSSSFESPKEQRNLTNWVADMEGLLGEPVSSPKADCSGEVKMTFSFSEERKQFRHMDTNTILKIFFLGEMSLYLTFFFHFKGLSLLIDQITKITLIHSSIDLVFPVPSISTFCTVGGLFLHPSSWRR